MSYLPPTQARRNALKAKECIDRGSPAMTRVGKARMNQLISGERLSKDTVKRMAAFDRHKKNAEYKGDPCKDRGYVAW